MKRLIPLSAPAPLAKPATAAAQEEMGAIIQTGAAVASIRYESLARETL